MAGKNGVLATLDPAVGQRQSAYALGLLMICGFVLTLPLFRAHVAFPAFDLVMHTASALMAALLAVLLLVQFVLLRGASLLLLGCGFLFVSLTALPQLVRVAQGLPPDPRLAFIAQLALPAAAIGYAALARAESGQVARGARVAAHLAGGIALTVGLAALCAWLAPASGQAHEWSIGARAVSALCLLAAEGTAMALLWRRRGAMFELWLLVALTAWMIATLLQAMAHDAATFAWRVAHVYGLLGVTCLVVALLAENFAWARRARSGGVRGAGGAHDPRMSEISAVDTVAEQLSQPLCAITANVDAIERLLDREAPDIAEVRAALGDISRDTQRASETIRMAQRLSAGAHEPPAEIDIGQLLDECLGQMRADMQLHRVTCEVETAGQLPGIRGIRRQLRHLLVNLFSNALEAMSEPQQRERRLRVRASRHDARAIVILVEDSGCGIRAQDTRRVFDPFFTTKPQRTGLGLAVCRSIAYAHGGHISVAEGTAGGTAFQVVLPVSS